MAKPYIERKREIEKLKQEIKKVFESHKVTGLNEVDDFDKLDNYIETHYHLIVDNEPWLTENIEELIADILEQGI